MVIFSLDSVNTHLWSLFWLFSFIFVGKSTLKGLIPSGDNLGQFKLERADIVLFFKVVDSIGIVHIITSNLKLVALFKMVIYLNRLNKLWV